MQGRHPLYQKFMKFLVFGSGEIIVPFGSRNVISCRGYDLNFGSLSGKKNIPSRRPTMAAPG